MLTAGTGAGIRCDGGARLCGGAAESARLDGFGQDFVQGIWGNVWGDQCYKDLMCVTDALETRADVDPQRLMAMVVRRLYDELDRDAD